MLNLEDDLLIEYLAESREHLVAAESDLLAMERDGAAVDEARINRLFRGIHTIKGGAGFFELSKIAALSHHAENVLALIRSRRLTPTPDSVRLLLLAVDRLTDMVQNPGTSNEVQIEELSAALEALAAGQESGIEAASPADVNQPSPLSSSLRFLLVEDDFTSRALLQSFLSRYGDCHVAVNGKEAVEAFRSALESGRPYDLICMDILMPELDGRQAVRQVRSFEEAKGIRSSCGAKIIMVTSIKQVREVFRCFEELCDAYLLKPIDLAQLLACLEAFHLIR